ncbi:MAG: hypothetical protein FAF03_12085 [Epsilonproteobacteria bacterium]|nr:hypothetical protein [Campylobacterota bacterium]
MQWLAPAFEYVGHTLTSDKNGGLGLDQNALSTQALITTSHALVGGTIAELSGGEFSSGAVASAVGHVVGEFVGNTLYADYQNGDITLDELQNTTLALSSAVGGATVLLTQEGVTAEELNRATAMAESVTKNNFLPLLVLAAEAGVSAEMLSALGVGTVALLVQSGGFSQQSLADAYNALPGNDTVAMVTSEGIEILDKPKPDAVIGGGIQGSVDDIKNRVTIIPGTNENDSPTIGGGITGELERPDVGGIATQPQERATVGGVQGELQTGGVYVAGDVVTGPNGGKGRVTEFTTPSGEPIIRRDSGGHYYTDPVTNRQVFVNSPSEHGNSASSTNAQHGYHIVDTDTGNRVKPGVSGQPLRGDGTSPRAQTQVDRLNEPFERERYTHEVVNTVPSGTNARRDILEWERNEATRLRNTGEIDPEIHQRP